MEIVKEISIKKKAKIFLVRDHDKEYAYKTINIKSEREKANILRTVRLAECFENENLISCYGWCEIEHHAGMLMEYVSGGDISKYAQDTASVLGAVLQLCRGIGYLHERGYVHGDIKASNVLITEDGVVKLADLDNIIDKKITDTDYQGSYTLGYAAPEVRQGKEADYASDIYSLGIQLGVLLSGDLQPEPAVDAIEKALHAADIPLELINIYNQMTRESAGSRYQNIAQVESVIINSETAGELIPEERLTSLLEPMLLPPRFINRSKELKEMSSLISEKGKILFIKGERGIGKSSLVEQLMNELLGSGQAVIKVSCRRHEPGLQTFSMILEKIFEQQGTGNIAELEARGVDFPEILGVIVPEFWGLGGRKQTLGSFKEKNPEMYVAFDNIIKKFYPEHLMIVIEDLHWASVELLNWLDFLSKSEIERSYNLICTYRQEEVNKKFAEDMDKAEVAGKVKIFDIEGLAAGHSRSVIDSMIIKDEEEFLDLEKIVARAEGNPLFLRDIMYYLFEQCSKAGSSEEEDVKDRGLIELPESIKEVILGKQCRLRRSSKYLLELLAAVGEPVGKSELEELSGIRESRLDVELSELMRVMYIIMRDGKYEFSHQSNQEVIYSSLPCEQRQQYHRQIVRAMECREELSYRDISVLAHHGVLTGDIETGIKYNIMLYNYLGCESGVLSDQELCCRRLIALYKERGMQVEALLWVINLQGVLTKKVKREAYEELLAEYRDLAEEVDDEHNRAMFWLSAADYYVRIQQLDESEKYLQKCSKYCESNRKNRSYLQYNLTRCIIYPQTGRMQEAYDLNKESLETAREIDDVDMERKLLGNQGYLYQLSGDFTSAEECFSRFKELAQLAGSAFDELTANNNLVLIKMRQGMFDEVEELLAEGKAKAKELGLIIYLANFYNHEGHLLYYKKDIKGALKKYWQALELYQQMGNKSIIGRLYSDIGVAYLEYDQKEAKRYLMLAKGHSEQIQDHFLTFLCTANLANLSLAKEDNRQALSYFLEGVALCEKYEFYLYLDKLLVDVGAIYLLLGEAESGRDSLEKGLAAARKNKNIEVIYKGLLQLGKYYRGKQDYENAENLLNEALSDFILSPVHKIRALGEKVELLKEMGNRAESIQKVKEEMQAALQVLPEEQKAEDIRELEDKLNKG